VCIYVLIVGGGGGGGMVRPFPNWKQWRQSYDASRTGTPYVAPPSALRTSDLLIFIANPIEYSSCDLYLFEFFPPGAYTDGVDVTVFFVTIAILQLWLFIGGDTDDNPYRHLRSVRVRSLWLLCLVYVRVCLILGDQFSTRYCHHSHLGPVTMFVDLTWTRTQSSTTVHWTTSNIDDECVFWLLLTVDLNICNSYLPNAQLLVNDSFSSWLKFEIIPLNIDCGIICPVRNQLNCTLLSVVCVAHLSRSRSAVLTLNIFVTLFNVNTCWIVCNLA